MSCLELRAYLEAFVDDELSAERTLDVQLHLRQCSSCQAEVELSRALVRTARKSREECLCPDFEARLRGSLAAECKKLEKYEPSRPLGWRTIAPLSAAAAAVLSLGFVASQRSALGLPEGRDEARKDQPLQAASNENLVDFLVRHHTKNRGAELQDVSMLEQLEPELGFPVHAPNLDRYGARLIGASAIRVNEARAASLHYVLNGRRFTLYVYDPDRMPLRTLRILHPTVVGDRAVFVGTHSGYSVATCERAGLGYAVAADLSDRESAELVAAVDR